MLPGQRAELVDTAVHDPSRRWIASWNLDIVLTAQDLKVANSFRCSPTRTVLPSYQVLLLHFFVKKKNVSLARVIAINPQES